MGQKNKGRSVAAFKFLFCLAFIILFSETAFGQASFLTLNPSSDVRLEVVSSNNSIAGYNLFVRKKPGVESVMLTEPTGNYALRSLSRNEINGNERRELSGVVLTEPNSLYSILSSTPIPDSQFGTAFQLFVPARIVYGSPSTGGPVLQDLLNGIRINIRTFDHKYADPNIGRFQNNLATITPMPGNYQTHNPLPDEAEKLRQELREKIEDRSFLAGMDEDEDLKKFLIYLFWEMERR